MKLVLIGPPGCGKGTQAVLIKEKYNIPQISTGDILRSAVRNGTPLGKEAEGYMNSGRLVPDKLIIDLMAERMQQPDCSNGYILDGFPRTIAQAEALQALLKKNGTGLDAVISIEVADDEVIKRLSGRRQCKVCGDGYHVEFKKPAVEGKCNKCGGELYQRDDDKEATIKNRLVTYRQQTEPLLNFFEKLGLLRKVEGTGSIEDIFNRVSSLIDKR